MHIVEVTQSLSRLGGGLFESVRYLAQHVQAANAARVTVIGLEDPRTADDIGQWAPLSERAHSVVGPKYFGFAPSLKRDLKDLQPDLVHLHCLWKYPAFAVSRWTANYGRPYVISPHGMLEPWALQQSRVRKRIALRLFQNSCLKRAHCIRVTSALEAEGVRRAGFANPLALIPNGIKLPPPPPLHINKGPCRPRRALFLSRLHPKKGVVNLIEAWNNVRPQGWELVLAGPDEAGHLAEVEAKVRACGLAHTVSLIGEVWGDAKTALCQDSDLFVLPSFSENFGLAIAEALSCGVPVITTRATPWAEVEQWKCGWWIEVGVDPLAQALRQAVSLPRDELRQMGLRGRRLIQNHYAWEPSARKMVEVYEWMIGRGQKPDCVMGV